MIWGPFVSREGFRKLQNNAAVVRRGISIKESAIQKCENERDGGNAEWDEERKRPICKKNRYVVGFVTSHVIEMSWISATGKIAIRRIGYGRKTMALPIGKKVGWGQRFGWKPCEDKRHSHITRSRTSSYLAIPVLCEIYPIFNERRRLISDWYQGQLIRGLISFAGIKLIIIAMIISAIAHNGFLPAGVFMFN